MHIPTMELCKRDCDTSRMGGLLHCFCLPASIQPAQEPDHKGGGANRDGQTNQNSENKGCPFKCVHDFTFSLKIKIPSCLSVKAGQQFANHNQQNEGQYNPDEGQKNHGDNDCGVHFDSP